MAEKIKQIHYLEDGAFTATPIGADANNIDIDSSLANTYSLYNINATDLSTLLQQLIEYINTNYSTSSDLSNVYAVKNHASSSTTYGIGTTSNYGHVKMTDNYSTTSANGLVPSLKAIQNLADDLSDKADKADSSTIEFSDSGDVITITYESGNVETITFEESSSSDIDTIITDIVEDESGSIVSTVTTTMYSDGTIGIEEDY